MRSLRQAAQRQLQGLLRKKGPDPGWTWSLPPCGERNRPTPPGSFLCSLPGGLCGVNSQGFVQTMRLKDHTGQWSRDLDFDAAKTPGTIETSQIFAEKPSRSVQLSSRQTFAGTSSGGGTCFMPNVRDHGHLADTAPLQASRAVSTSSLRRDGVCPWKNASRGHCLGSLAASRELCRRLKGTRLEPRSASSKGGAPQPGGPPPELRFVSCGDLPRMLQSL